MDHVIATAAVTPLLREPTTRAEQLNQIILGETAELRDTRGEWRRVRLERDGYDGWAHCGYLIQVDRAAADDWRRRAEAWSDGAVLKVAGRLVRLPVRARVELDAGEAILPDGRRGLIVSGGILPYSEEVRAAMDLSPERWALARFDGAPYQWGGVTPWGVDCSGLVQTTFAARGVALPRDSSQQATCGREVPYDNARPGDLLFFSDEGQAIAHVAFVGAESTLVHSTIACGGFVCESWSDGTRAATLRGRLVAVRRIER